MGTVSLWSESPADYLINGLVKLLVDGRAADARVAIAKADEALFESAVDRDLFRSLRRAVDFTPSPGPLEVRFLIEHDDDGGSPVEDVVARLAHAVEVSAAIGWEHHIESALQHLESAYASRCARDLGRELVSAASTPSPERCEQVIQLARRIQDGATSGTRANAATLVEVVQRWQANRVEKRVTTGFRPIDKPLGGGLPVGLHGIAAAPGAGKSALALQLAIGALMNNPEARVVWMRGEMTNDLLLSRMLACWSHLQADDTYPITLRDALERSPDAQAACRSMLELIGDRLVIVDAPITPSSIERWIDEIRPSLVIVDYLQKVEVVGFKDRRTELDHAVRRISNASTRAEIPIIVVSSVPKGAGEHSDIGSITKETNQLDFEVHTFWSLWTQGDKNARPRRVLLRNNKSRTGETCDEELWFNGAGQVYELAAAPEYEEFGGFAPR